jgi:2'-5' RNA ligase
MLHRIFIAINLPEDVKKELVSFREKWPDLPIRWTQKENLHITLVFIGNTSDEDLLNIFKTVREAASRHKSFAINLNRISYGPPKKPPRMVWAIGEKSKELAELKDDLENGLLNLGGQKYKVLESQPFSPHITLGRIKEWEFRKIDPEERPAINEEVSLSFEVKSIELMESELRRAGPEYTILESAQLANLH